ncbi:hypothetical protein AMTR_s00037p00095030 [Amborella trichopoda]|uniref:Uncharacterized protein n=1 Tax=Amborella trichopoda TaxID=13333 RepID=U5D515_AMBTC|nr:hypothetical protein AMTR_s00037p00095030 [Amborella trichopoda]
MLGSSISRGHQGVYCNGVHTAANVLNGKKRAWQQEACGSKLCLAMKSVQYQNMHGSEARSGEK